MRFKNLKSGIALCLLLFAVNALQLSAQDRPSIVKGKVIDQADHPLAGVSVTVTNTKTNFIAGTSTDSAGIFTFNRVSSGGPYSFTFSNPGYENQTLSGYTIKADIMLSLVIRMRNLVANVEEVFFQE